jgi:hypothetical protein
MTLEEADYPAFANSTEEILGLVAAARCSLDPKRRAGPSGDPAQWQVPLPVSLNWPATAGTNCQS